MQYCMNYTLKYQSGSKINTWHVPNVNNSILMKIVSVIHDSNQKHTVRKRKHLSRLVHLLTIYLNGKFSTKQ